jgi:hypothetical protein
VQRAGTHQIPVLVTPESWALRDTTHASFLLGNAQALAAEQKSFVVDTYDVPCSCLTRPYPEQSRSIFMIGYAMGWMEAAGRGRSAGWKRSGSLSVSGHRSSKPDLWLAAHGDRQTAVMVF